MADNYLEKRMEEHRAGERRLFREKTKKTRAVFVVDALSPGGTAAIEKAMDAGCCRIAFSADDYARGSRLAQATGGRFYCISPRLTLQQAIADARSHFAPLNLEVIEAENDF